MQGSHKLPPPSFTLPTSHYTWKCTCRLRYEDNNLQRQRVRREASRVRGTGRLRPWRSRTPRRHRTPLAVAGRARTASARGWHRRGHGGGKDIRRGDKRGDLDFQKRSRRQPKSKKRRAVPRRPAQVYPKRPSAPLHNRRARERARGALNLPVERWHAALSTPRSRLDASLRLLSGGARCAACSSARAAPVAWPLSSVFWGTWTVPLCSARSLLLPPERGQAAARMSTRRIVEGRTV